MQACLAVGGGRPDLDAASLAAVLAAFYAAVTRDPLLAPSFADLDLPAHLPQIERFWATTVFGARTYDGNVFRPHLTMPGLTPAHFARWVAVLEATVDAAHAGPDAERMKALAHRVAYSMQLRLGLTPVSAAFHAAAPP